MNKESNFISAVVYLNNDSKETIHFFESLNECLDTHFLRYEIIAVNGDHTHNPANDLKAWAQTIKAPVTIVNMSQEQPHEQCMNAGLDISIGDYVYEFDYPDAVFDMELIFEAYQKSMSGYDIVNVCTKQMKGLSKAFYKVFNRYSGSGSEIRTDVFRLVSRRAVNRVHSVSENLPYRKAAYAVSGLKATTMLIDVTNKRMSKHNPSFNLAIDSLILYTDFGYKFSIGLALLMLLISLLEVIYTVVIWLMGIPIEGWTSTVLVITFGFTCLFTLQTILIKHLHLLLGMTFKKKQYMIENVDKV